MNFSKQLVSMSAEQLIELREAIDKSLGDKLRQEKAELRTKLARLERYTSKAPASRGVKKGTTVAPKYRGPNGETWAGRGVKPNWLAALIKKGNKQEKYLIAAKRKG
jgi:DNA-binding protein H-NS